MNQRRRNGRSNVDEVGGALRAEIGRCCVRAAEQAAILESIAARALDLGVDVFRDGTSAELTICADSIRGLVLHALATIAELQVIGGRLAACAAMRAAEEAANTQPGGPGARPS